MKYYLPVFILMFLMIAPAAEARRSIVIGDSLTVGTEPYLSQTGWGTRVDARVGRGTDEGLRVLSTMPRWRYLVLGLGTNDGANDLTRTRRMVRRGLTHVGETGCMVTYTLYNKRRSHSTQNRWLRTEARNNRRVVLVDWHKMIQNHPSYLAGDGVHGTVAGYRARGAATMAALNQCAADIGG